MRLNLVEFLLMTHPLRGIIHRHVEARLMEKAAGGSISAGRALEIGCGRGVGAEVILDRFEADSVDAFDYDPRMVTLARKRLAGISGVGAVWTGDATQIAAAGNAYDSVFTFGAIHHIVNWRKAVSEVHRVLKPGGTFYAQEVFRNLILHPLWRRLLDHPLVDRFDFDQFGSALADAGFTTVGSRRLGRSMGWFVAKKE